MPHRDHEARVSYQHKQMDPIKPTRATLTPFSFAPPCASLENGEFFVKCQRDTRVLLSGCPLDKRTVRFLRSQLGRVLFADLFLQSDALFFYYLVVQNVAKIEQAAHHWIDNQVDMDDDNEEMRELRSPTLRELMEYEIDANVHDNSKLPRLKDKTAAMGLLWVRRQLQYQTALFANVIQVPAVFESTNAAVSAGYAEVYGKYHGWAVQKIFNYSFQSAPEPSEIFKVMNPHRLKEVLASLEATGAGRIPNNDKMNPLEKIGKHIGSEWDKLAGSVGSEWGKLADSVVRLFHYEPQQQVNPTHGAAFVEQREENMYVDVNQLVAEEMQKDAFQNIDSFLHVAKPLLADLAGVFGELNMDDPSKV
jgi:hypothetical protein